MPVSDEVGPGGVGPGAQHVAASRDDPLELQQRLVRQAQFMEEQGALRKGEHRAHRGFHQHAVERRHEVDEEHCRWPLALGGLPEVHPHQQRTQSDRATRQAAELSGVGRQLQVRHHLPPQHPGVGLARMRA